MKTGEMNSTAYILVCLKVFSIFWCPVFGNFRAPSAGISGVQEITCPFAQGLHANLLRFISGEGFHR